MDEALYRQRQAVARLFDGAATITGSIGTAKAPGELRIVADGRTLGEGRTFGQALADVTVRSGPERKTAGRG